MDSISSFISQSEPVDWGFTSATIHIRDRFVFLFNVFCESWIWCNFRFPKDLRLLPLEILSCTIGLHLLYTVFRQTLSRLRGRTGSDGENRNGNAVLNLNDHIHNYGGPVTFALSIARLAGTLSLLVLSAITSRECGKELVGGTELIQNCPESALTVSFVSLVWRFCT